MKDSPLISIATPCFNSEGTIERTIKSILDQDFKDYEYIIVDGGSTDGTLDIIKRYEPLFEGRMKWKSEFDNGLYDAFNKGVKRSTGIYCWNVNADDWIEKDCLGKLAEKLLESKDKENVFIGSMKFHDEQGRVKYRSQTTEEMLPVIYKKDWMIPHPATVVSKSVYDKYGAFDTRFRICGDMDWFHRTYAAGVPFEVHSEILLTNMVSEGVSTRLIYKKEVADRWLFFTKKYGKGIKRLVKLFNWHFLYLKKKAKKIW